ncbi:MAG: GWxTD domain-containing protein [Melioribacteraceae bacterium]|nr:MAG: GWxTD domain-containing protein [Melioribacteraceae bacterium]
MRGIRFCKYFCLLFLFTFSLFGQNNFEYDYARFYNPADGSSYVELYYSFVRSALSTVSTEDKNVSQGKLAVKIIDKRDNQIVFNNMWQLDIENSTTDDDKLLVGLLDFPLPESEYLFDISAEDLNNPEFNFNSSFDISVTPFPESSIVVSDIQLATAIIPQSQNTESIFYKNSIEITPNPSLIYGDSNPVLFFYSEIYGLSSGAVNNFIIEQKLFDATNTMVHDKQRKISNEHSSVVEVGAIKVNELNSGIYTLVISIRDDLNMVSANSTKKVFIYNRDRVDESTNFAESQKSMLESELMIMSDDEIDYMYETAVYIATEAEKQQWKKLSDYDAKRKFLSSFWEKRDSDPTTEINEYKRDYYERVAYANKNYGNVSRKEGWKTDRGRVYITYGAPGEIERFQNEYYSQPYEIWQYYNLDGGVIFLFADEQSLNIYKLVHSTKKGEIYNYNQYLKYVQ